MKYPLLILLACLFLTGSAGALANAKLATTLDLSPVYDIACTQDTFAPSPNTSIIWVVLQSGYADVYIDGEGKQYHFAETLGGKPGKQYGVSPGVHTVSISRQGYSTYTKQVQVCSGKVSYVFYDLAVQAITTTPTTVAAPTTTVTTTTTAVQGSTTQVTQQQTQQQRQAVTAAVTATTQPDALGSLSVATTPAGAFIFVDGVQRGVTPATIPGIPAGTHTLLLKLDGYQDISTPVTIAAGKTQEYSSAMAKAVATAAATTAAAIPADTGVTPKKSPGFAFIAALAGLGAVLCLRKGRSG